MAAYKAMWRRTGATGATGYTTDLLAAIDAAITDGVDVINYSISGGRRPDRPGGPDVPVGRFGRHLRRGVSRQLRPWRVDIESLVSVGDYRGRQHGRSVRRHGDPGQRTEVRRRLHLGDHGGRTGSPGDRCRRRSGRADRDRRGSCGPDSLDPAKTAGKIVVCDRGTYDRVAKSAEVKRAGGIGMVLANPTENSLDGDLHTVPTVHVNPPASAAIKTYAATAGATATLTEGNETATATAYPQIATFSSRGPSLGNGGDTLKPISPLPGWPSSRPSRRRGRTVGTSTSSRYVDGVPHAAGPSALWFGAGVQPRWSPMRVKSADYDGRRSR